MSNLDLNKTAGINNCYDQDSLIFGWSPVSVHLNFYIQIGLLLEDITEYMYFEKLACKSENLG